jgi:hypothetical protein
MDQPFELITDPQGKLILRRPGQEDAQDVRIRRAFPWSRPDRLISIRSAEGKELLLIEDLGGIPAEQGQIITQHLDATTFVPRILHVEAVDVSFGHQNWRVMTDRGPIEFRVQEREDIRFLHDGRFTIKDADGNIYEMPRLDQLDEKSRRAVESLV